MAEKLITVSLKDAVKIRPDEPRFMSERDRVHYANPRNKLPAMWTGQPSRRREPSVQIADAVVSTPFWRPEDFRTFKGLTEMACARDPVMREQAAGWLRDFQRKHGVEKCDMMLGELRRQDAEVWFADKHKLKGA